MAKLVTAAHRHHNEITPMAGSTANAATATRVENGPRNHPECHR